MQKHFFFFLLSLFFSHLLNAQLFLSGRVGLEFSSEKIQSTEERTKTSAFIFVPRIAKTAGNWVAGFDLGIERTSTDERDPFTGKPIQIITTNNIVGTFMRYVKKPNDFMGVWVEMQIGGSFGNEKIRNKKSADLSGFYTGFRPGIIFFINKHLSFEGSFGSLAYRSNKYKRDDSIYPETEKTSSGGLIVNPNTFQFAVNWTFQKHRSPEK